MLLDALGLPESLLTSSSKAVFITFGVKNKKGKCWSAGIDFLLAPAAGLHSNVVPFFGNSYWQYYRSVALDPSEKSEVNDRARVSRLPRAEPGHSCNAYPSFYDRLGPGRWLSPRRCRAGSIHITFAFMVEHTLLPQSLLPFDARLLHACD